MGKRKVVKMWKMAHLASIGPAVAFSIFIGLGIGVYLDREVFGTTPWLTLIFLGLGIAAAFKNLLYAIKRAEKYSQEDEL